MVHSLPEVERILDKVGEDLWSCDAPEPKLDGVLQKLSRLQAQVRVQISMQTTAELLRQQQSDKALPNQRAVRVRHLIKFVFEKTTEEDERQTRLRKLGCNALKFCGLCYMLKELLRLPDPDFDFLVENVSDFIERQRLLQYLYRDDIDNAVNSKVDPEDDDLFKEFQIHHIQHRPAKRKRVDSSLNTRPEATVDAQIADLNRQAQAIQAQGPDTSVVPAGREIQYKCSNAPSGSIYLFGDVISNAIQSSRQWRLERDIGGESMTDCLNALIPKDRSEDIHFTFLASHEEGYALIDRFKLKFL